MLQYRILVQIKGKIRSCDTNYWIRSFRISSRMLQGIVFVKLLFRLVSFIIYEICTFSSWFTWCTFSIITFLTWIYICNTSIFYFPTAWINLPSPTKQMERNGHLPLTHVSEKMIIYWFGQIYQVEKISLQYRASPLVMQTTGGWKLSQCCSNVWGPWELDTVPLGMNYVPGRWKHSPAPNDVKTLFWHYPASLRAPCRKVSYPGFIPDIFGLFET